MRGRVPANVALRPEDLALLERVFAQVIPEHDTHPDELAMLLAAPVSRRRSRRGRSSRRRREMVSLTGRVL
jgi:hypothetical protein